MLCQHCRSHVELEIAIEEWLLAPWRILLLSAGEPADDEVVLCVHNDLVIRNLNIALQSQFVWWELWCFLLCIICRVILPSEGCIQSSDESALLRPSYIVDKIFGFCRRYELGENVFPFVHVLLGLGPEDI